MTERNKKLMILVALIAVVGVSIGFAAFSSSLLIKSSLSVNPTDGNFKILFSSRSDSLATDEIKPSTTSTAIIANNAVINNDADPKIENLGGTFTEPGQSITYTFYAINHKDYSKYDTYLTSIVFQNLTSGVFKECNATDGTNSDLVTSACNNIGITVQVGSEIATSTTLGISNHRLLKESSETVTITLSYESNGTLADEPFTVNFGNIYLTYGTQETDEMPNLPESAICTAVNSSQSGSTDLGTEYKCDVDPNLIEDYTFYVLSTSGDNVSLLMSKNLQDNVPYVSRDNFNAPYTEGWGYGYHSDYNDTTPYIIEQLNSLTSSWTNITSLNETYSGLWTIVLLTGKARLATYEEIAGHVCTFEGVESALNGVCWEDCASWALGDYWTLSDYYGWNVYAMNTRYNTLDDFGVSYANEYGTEIYYDNYGIRPVITVQSSQLN